MTIIRTQAVIRLPMSIDHNAVHQRIKDCETLEEKQELIRKTNPLLYALGDHLIPRNGMDYADWVSKLYIGEVCDE